LSHAAAAAPLARYGLVLSALVIGSFSPDFIYFIRLSPVGHFTHTVPGLLLFCLPAGMAVLWIYHRLLKEPLAGLLPGPLRPSSLHQPFRFLPLQRLGVLAMSITVGASTHWVWDAFTHEDGAALRFLPFLGMSVIDLGFEGVPLTRVLHHAGSLVGLVWMAFQARPWVLRAGRESGACRVGREEILRSGSAVLLLLGASAVLGILYAWGQGFPPTDFDGLRRMTIKAMVASGASLSALLVAYGIIWHLACAREGKG
jgi:hypothetical protein